LLERNTPPEHPAHHESIRLQLRLSITSGVYSSSAFNWPTSYTSASSPGATTISYISRSSPSHAWRQGTWYRAPWYT
jgi:hypothetical protein